MADDTRPGDQPRVSAAAHDSGNGRRDIGKPVEADREKLLAPSLAPQISNGAAANDGNVAGLTPRISPPAGLPHLTLTDKNAPNSGPGSAGKAVLRAGVAEPRIAAHTSDARGYLPQIPKPVEMHPAEAKVGDSRLNSNQPDGTSNSGGSYYHLDQAKIQGRPIWLRLPVPARDKVDQYVRFKQRELRDCPDQSLENKYRALADAKAVVGGWKIHIPLTTLVTDNVPFNYKGQTLPTTPRDPVAQTLCKFCIDQGIVQFKVGKGGELESGKGMTIYVGSYQNLQKVVAAMGNYRIDGQPLSLYETPPELRRSNACFKADAGGKPLEIFARWDVEGHPGDQTAYYSGASTGGVDHSLEGVRALSVERSVLVYNRNAGTITQDEYDAQAAEAKRRIAVRANEGWQMLFGEVYSGEKSPDARPWFAAPLYDQVPLAASGFDDYKLIRCAVNATNPDAPEAVVRRNFDASYKEALALAPQSLRRAMEVSGPTAKAYFVGTYRRALVNIDGEIGTADTRRSQIDAAFRDLAEAIKDRKRFNEGPLKAFKKRADAMPDRTAGVVADAQPMLTRGKARTGNATKGGVVELATGVGDIRSTAGDGFEVSVRTAAVVRAESGSRDDLTREQMERTRKSTVEDDTASAEDNARALEKMKLAEGSSNKEASELRLARQEWRRGGMLKGVEGRAPGIALVGLALASWYAAYKDNNVPVVYIPESDVN